MQSFSIMMSKSIHTPAPPRFYCDGKRISANRFKHLSAIATRKDCFSNTFSKTHAYQFMNFYC